MRRFKVMNSLSNRYYKNCGDKDSPSYGEAMFLHWQAASEVVVIV
jgi:hypothetical protein